MERGSVTASPALVCEILGYGARMGQIKYFQRVWKGMLSQGPLPDPPLPQNGSKL